LSQSLLHRVAQGEEAAVRECLSQFGGLVWTMARRMCDSAADAEDAVQEIFIDVWKSAARFDAGIASETAFVATIARRRLIDRRRRAGRSPVPQPLNEVDVSGGDAGESVDLCDEASRAAEALRQLRPEQRDVLKLAIYEGLTHQEIAERTGLALGTVKTHARRGLIRVREMLQVSVSGAAGEASP
jgi:RNA polymerase sigma-70 factor (ECF subfamily)